MKVLEIMSAGTIMYCFCSYEVIVRARQRDGATEFEFLDSSMRMISSCPNCGAKFNEPGDLQYCEPTEYFAVNGIQEP